MMARHFNETNQYIEISDTFRLSYGNAFTLSMWLYFDDNSGSLFQYFWSHGPVGTGDSINLFAIEEGAADGGKMRAIVGMEDFWGVVNNLSNFSIDTGKWMHYMVTKNGTTVEQFKNGVSGGTSSGGLDDPVNPAGNLDIGRRQDGDASRYFGGRIAEIARWDRVLTSAEKQQLTKYSPDFIPKDLEWYMPLIRETHELQGFLSLTNQGSTADGHPPIIKRS